MQPTATQVAAAQYPIYKRGRPLATPRQVWLYVYSLARLALRHA